MRREHTRTALAAVVIAAPLLLALLPGKWFDEEGVGMNRNVEPIDLPASLHGGLTLAAAIALGAGLLALLSPGGRQAVHRDDVMVAAPLLAAGLYIAFTYRVATAAVSGANIGAGLLFMLGVLILPTLVGLAAYTAWRVRRRPTQTAAGLSMARRSTSPHRRPRT